jgi:hypothetical protein
MKLMIVMLLLFMLLPPMTTFAVNETIHGIVTDANGIPLEGIRVAAITSDLLVISASTFTLADGSYSFPSLSAGTFKITFFDPTGLYEEYTANNISLLTSGNVEVNPTLNLALSIQSVMFRDTDQSIGHLTGNVTWASASDLTTTGYEIYFADELNNLLGSAIGHQAKNPENPQYSVPISIAIPSSATRLAVVSVNGSVIEKQVTIPIWENVSISSGPFSFTDTNGQANDIDATLTWNKSSNETLIYDYVIYYRDSSFKEHELAAIPKDGRSIYSVNLSSSIIDSIPSNVEYLILGTKNTRGEYATFNQIINISDNLLSVTTDIPLSNVELNAVSDLSFSDHDSNANEIGGYLSWQDNTGNHFSDYMIYFVNSQGGKIKRIAKVKKTNLTYLTLTIPNDTPIPAGTTAIGIFSRNSEGNESINFVQTPIWDNPNTSFVDINPDENAITAKLNWNGLIDETLISKYVIFYIDSSHHRQVAARVDKTNNAHYSYTLTSDEFSLVPANAKGLLIGTEDSNGTMVAVSPTSNEILDNTGNKLIKQSAITDVSLGAASNAFMVYKPEHAVKHIAWTYPSAHSNISSFVLYFLDSAGQKLKSLAMVKNSTFGFSNIYIPSDTVIPANATKIGIFSKNTYGGESSKYAVIPLFDQIRASLDPNNQGLGVDKIVKFISGDGSFRREDIQALLYLIDPITREAVVP